MTTILPAERSPFDAIMSQLGQQLGHTLPQAAQRYGERQALRSSLDQISQMAQSGASPLDITLATMKAGAGIPGSERYMGQIIPMLQQLASANVSQKVPLPGEDRQREMIPQQAQSQQMPGFMQPQGQPQEQMGMSQFYPNNIGPQGGPGHAYQPVTERKPESLMSPKEQMKAARELSAESTKSGQPMKVIEALEQIKAQEEYKKLYNESIEADRKALIESQKDYGSKAVNHLEKVMPNASPEDKAIFKKKGEEAALSGDSEAEIDRKLAKDASNFANTIAAVEKDISAPRLYNRIHRAMLGEDKDFKKAAEDMRVKLRPLLEMGMYDKANNLLSKRGYAPEEREIILNPLSEREAGTMNNLPKYFKHRRPELVERQFNNLKESILEVLRINPNASQPLLRREAEKKGYDWSMYKDALNEILKENPQAISQEQFQRNMEVLDSPPLNYLERYLEAFNLVGR